MPLTYDRMGEGLHKIARVKIPKSAAKKDIQRIKRLHYKNTLEDIKSLALELLPPVISTKDEYAYGESGYFAAELLTGLQCLQEALKSKSPERIAAQALSLGMSYERIRLDYLWNKHALRGEAVLNANERSKDYNNKYSAERRKVWVTWGKEAATIWKEIPSLPAIEVARRVKKRLKLLESPETIRKKISHKKPGKTPKPAQR